MRTLLLMRHAKSDWTSSQIPDKDRVLNPRGKQDAPRMAAWLADNDLRPGVALVSGAQRTTETWGLMQPAFGAVKTIYSDALYLAGPEDMLDAINGVEVECDTLILIAHQPGMAALTRMLSRDMSSPELEGAFAHFPTASIAVMRSKADHWHDVAHKSCAFLEFQRPKQL